MNKFLPLIIFLLLSATGLPAQKAPITGGSTTTSTCVLTDAQVMIILKEAAPLLNATHIILWDQYQNATCTVHYIDKTALGYRFSVTSGGITITVIMGSF